jgi:hypothetical protein
MVAGVAHETPQTRAAVLGSLLRIRRIDVLWVPLLCRAAVHCPNCRF